MEVWVQMYEDYPMYEVSSIGNVRNMQTNKILKIRADRVLLRDKNNSMKWVNVKYLVFKYFGNSIDTIKNYLETNTEIRPDHMGEIKFTNIDKFPKGCYIFEWMLFYYPNNDFKSMDELYNRAKMAYETYSSWHDENIKDK